MKRFGSLQLPHGPSFIADWIIIVFLAPHLYLQLCMYMYIEYFYICCGQLQLISLASEQGVSVHPKVY